MDADEINTAIYQLEEAIADAVRAFERETESLVVMGIHLDRFEQKLFQVEVAILVGRKKGRTG